MPGDVEVPETENEQEPAGQAPEGEGGEFDRERAMDTIRKQRESEKAALAELKAAKKRLQELEAAEEERANAELSEKQRLEKELEKAQQAAEKAAADLQTREQQFNERLIRAEVRAAAAGMQFANPEDAYHLADLSEVAVGEDGEIKGVKKALDKLVKDKPYLLSTEAERSPGTPPRGGIRRAPAGKAVPDRRVDEERPIVSF
jgi:chromosome segregation ATPase